MNKNRPLISHLPNYDLPNQRVFLRADLNVPLNAGSISCDHRLLAALPTIDLILQKGGTIVLATHIGRPSRPSPELSTRILIPWFENRGYSIRFEPDLEKAHALSMQDNNQIVLLENMRFFPGEQTDSRPFALQLAQLGDYYVNDAFASLHRHDTSIAFLPTLFPREKRTIGLLIEKELGMLNKLLHNPAQPFVLGLGGGKVEDKLPLLYAMLDIAQVILLCPAIVFTFLQAQGKPVGNSLVDTKNEQACMKFLESARVKKVKILFPVDYQIAQDTFMGPLSLVEANEFPKNGVGIAIGPKTAALYAQEIRNANTVFYNGLMGDLRRKETLDGIASLFTAMGASQALSIVGGGDSVGAAYLLGLEKNISYLSTGGGVILAYLTGAELPGLQAYD